MRQGANDSRRDRRYLVARQRHRLCIPLLVVDLMKGLQFGQKSQAKKARPRWARRRFGGLTKACPLIFSEGPCDLVSKWLH